MIQRQAREYIPRKGMKIRVEHVFNSVAICTKFNNLTVQKGQSLAGIAGTVPWMSRYHTWQRRREETKNGHEAIREMTGEEQPIPNGVGQEDYEGRKGEEQRNTPQVKGKIVGRITVLQRVLLAEGPGRVTLRLDAGVTLPTGEDGNVWTGTIPSDQHNNHTN